LNNDYVSQPRNKLIAEIFKASGLIKKYGLGIKRVLKDFENYGLQQPEFRIMRSGFMVKVFSIAYSEVSYKGDEIIHNNVTENVQKTE
jgi:ATP-dependent DNA helicase RecG